MGLRGGVGRVIGPLCRVENAFIILLKCLGTEGRREKFWQRKWLSFSEKVVTGKKLMGAPKLNN